MVVAMSPGGRRTPPPFPGARSPMQMESSGEQQPSGSYGVVYGGGMEGSVPYSSPGGPRRPPPLFGGGGVDAGYGMASSSGMGMTGLGSRDHPLFEEELLRGGAFHASTRLRFRQDVGRQAARIAEAAGTRVPRESR